MINVAHERELGLRENAGNYAVAALTLVLGVTALVETGILGSLMLITVAILIMTYHQLERAGPLDIHGLAKRRNR